MLLVIHMCLSLKLQVACACAHRSCAPPVARRSLASAPPQVSPQHMRLTRPAMLPAHHHRRFATGPNLYSSDALIQEFYSKEGASPSSSVHILLDTTLSGKRSHGAQVSLPGCPPVSLSPHQSRAFLKQTKEITAAVHILLDTTRSGKRKRLHGARVSVQTSAPCWSAGGRLVSDLLGRRCARSRTRFARSRPTSRLISNQVLTPDLGTRGFDRMGPLLTVFGGLSRQKRRRAALPSKADRSDSKPG